MSTADDLDRHMRETTDMARTAMADMLTAVVMSARRTTPGTALAAASSLQATAARLQGTLMSARDLIASGDNDMASLDAARAMSLSDYASKLARLRTIAAQMSDYEEAQSGSVS